MEYFQWTIGGETAWLSLFWLASSALKLAREDADPKGIGDLINIASPWRSIPSQIDLQGSGESHIINVTLL